MAEAFEHQEPMTNFAFSRPASQPQQVGVRLKPEGKKPAEGAPRPARRQERGAF